MERNVVRFLGRKMWWCSSTAIGFCNNAKHVGPRWMVVYFKLYSFFIIFICINNPLTNIQVLLVMFLNYTLNGLGLVLLIEIKWMTIWMVWYVCCSHSQFRNAIIPCPLLGTCIIYKKNVSPKLILSKKLQINIGC